MKVRNPDPNLVLGYDPVITRSKTKMPNGFQFVPAKDANVYEYITIHTDLTFLSVPVTAFSQALERLYNDGSVFTYSFTVASDDEYYQTGIHIVFKLSSEYNIMDHILAIKKRYLHEAKINYNPEL